VLGTSWAGQIAYTFGNGKANLDLKNQYFSILKLPSGQSSTILDYRRCPLRLRNQALPDIEYRTGRAADGKEGKLMPRRPAKLKSVPRAPNQAALVDVVRQVIGSF
jgi:hypothetical protein